MSAKGLPFFDPSAARGPREGPDVGRRRSRDDAASKAAPWSVSALVAKIKNVLSDGFPATIHVVGELSNVKRHSSGHVYFRLKDANAAIDAVMFRSAAAKLKFRAENGMEVVADGRVDLYEVRGQLQLYVERMTPRGAGALELAFRQLREKLASEGFFAPEHKKPIPPFPRAVGIVTSPTGAAIRDIRRTMLRRWPGVRAYLLPVRVQGDRAAGEIAEAIALLDTNAERYEIDTLIVGRGGGSLEDLWAFNEEIVARAVHAASTPIISGVGHEVDVTICDLVADARAATPTAAAQLAVPDAGELSRRIATIAATLTRRVSEQVRTARAALQAAQRSSVFRDPAGRVRTQAQRIDELSHRLRAALGQTLSRSRAKLEPSANRLASLHPARLAERARSRIDRLAERLRWALGKRSKRAGDTLSRQAGRLEAVHPRHRLTLARQRIEATARQLDALSHRSALRRGFSVTRTADGRIVRSVGQVGGGDRIETELTDGRIRSVVEGAAASRKRASKRKRKDTQDDQKTLFD